MQGVGDLEVEPDRGLPGEDYLVALAGELEGFSDVGLQPGDLGRGFVHGAEIDHPPIRASDRHWRFMRTASSAVRMVDVLRHLGNVITVSHLKGQCFRLHR